LFGFLTPRLTEERFAAARPHAVFLGAILSRSDLEAVGVPPKAGKRQEVPAGLPPGRAATSYHAKEPQASVKPLPALTDWQAAVRPPEASLAPARGAGMPAGPGRHVSFYVFDPPAFLRNVDFSDLKKMAGREEVASHMEVEVTVAAGGSVRAVRRITGSGDPILDSFIIFKLQRAVFQTQDPDAERPVRLYLRLK
jgi:hypothetical protein